MAKLSKPQLALLRASASEAGGGCSASYAPLQTLRLLKLVTVTVSKYGYCTVRLTEAGRAALAEGGAK